MATYETAENRYVNAGGTHFAYRRLGRLYGTPWFSSCFDGRMCRTKGRPQRSQVVPALEKASRERRWAHCTFFCSSETIRDHQRPVKLPAWLLGIASPTSRPNRSEHVGAKGAHAQATLFVNLMDPRQAGEASYDRFRELQFAYPDSQRQARARLSLPSLQYAASCAAFDNYYTASYSNVAAQTASVSGASFPSGGDNPAPCKKFASKLAAG
ncbi:hypothetical protein EsHS_00004007 [Epichloe bromicola]